MKVYLFNVTSGLYEGEDFMETGEVREEEGITNIAPPAYQPGQVPFYDPVLGTWKLATGSGLRAAEKSDG